VCIKTSLKGEGKIKKPLEGGGEKYEAPSRGRKKRGKSTSLTPSPSRGGSGWGWGYLSPLANLAFSPDAG